MEDVPGRIPPWDAERVPPHLPGVALPLQQSGRWSALDLSTSTFPWSASLGQLLFGETDQLLAWIVLAIGGALAVGTALALVRPRPEGVGEGELERPPLARSVVMIVIGGLAALWAAGSLLAG